LEDCAGRERGKKRGKWKDSAHREGGKKPKKVFGAKTTVKTSGAVRSEKNSAKKETGAKAGTECPSMIRGEVKGRQEIRGGTKKKKTAQKLFQTNGQGSLKKEDEKLGEGGKERPTYCAKRDL